VRSLENWSVGLTISKRKLPISGAKNGVKKGLFRAFEKNFLDYVRVGKELLKTQKKKGVYKKKN